MSANPYEQDGEGGAYSAAGGGAYEDVPNVGSNEYDNAEGDVELGNQNTGVGPTQPPPPPGPKPTVPQAPPVKGGYFARLNIPVTYLTVVISVWLIAGSILNMILSKPALSDVIIDVYFIFFAIAFLIMMLPNVKWRGCQCFKKMRDSIEVWARFLSTNWGRGWFFIFISFLAFGMNSAIRIITGILLILTGIISIWCGRLAAAKYNRLREYLAAGHEGDAFMNSVQVKGAPGFNDDGFLTEAGVKKLITNSGRTATSSEIHAIYVFFDRDHTGEVDIEEFAARLSERVRLKSL